MVFKKIIAVDAPMETMADKKINALQLLAQTTDTDTLIIISELMQKEGASAKFNKLLNNPFVRGLLK